MIKPLSSSLSHVRRLTVPIAAAFSAVALSLIPAMIPAVAFATDTPEAPCEITDHSEKFYLWIGTGAKGETNSDETVLGSRQIAKVEMNPSFTSGTTVFHFPTDEWFGDIAVLPDSSAAYGLRFSAPADLHKYNGADGTEEYVKPLSEVDQNGAALPWGFNSLSLGPNGELLFSSYKEGGAGAIYSVDPNENSDELTVTKRDFKFPKTAEGKQIRSAGDFIVLPDRSIIGFGNVGGKTAVVKWKDKSGALYGVDPIYSGPGIILGLVNEKIFGAARVGSHILAITNHASPNNNLEVLDIELSAGREENGENTPIPFKPIFIPGFSGAVYGASTSGDAGLASNESRLVTKVSFQPDDNGEFPTGRARGEADQARAWSSDPCGKTLDQDLNTTGDQPNLQDPRHVQAVISGSKHQLHELLLRNGELQGIGGFYETTVSCVDENGLDVPVEPIELSSDGADAEVTVPDTVDGTTTCTFVNTPVKRSTSLPLTGAGSTLWQLLASVMVLVILGAYPWLRNRKETGART